MLGLTNQQPTLTSVIAGFMNAGGFGSAIVRKSVTFANTAGHLHLFTVTGDVLVVLAAVGKGVCASAGGCNASVGITGSTAAIIALTNVTLINVSEIWHDNSPDAYIEDSSVLKRFIITGSNDILLTLSAQADSGQIDFDCFWTPLSAGATVVPV
jgi:hypothetical protein